jgi:hypothetical protein
MTNTKRSFLIVAGATAISLSLAVVTSYLFAHRARTHAARYLQVVAPLRIGTGYSTTVAQLRNAQIPLTLPDKCERTCRLEFRFDDKLLYRLHLAAPSGLYSSLEFRNGTLTQKSTEMSRNTCCSAAVIESSQTSSKTTHNVNSLGQTLWITVELSADDFTAYRTQAYSFDVRCIGAHRECQSEDYLPLVSKKFRRPN